MKVLVACECSGTVRDAFLEAGHDAYSCDLKPDEKYSDRHYCCDVLELLERTKGEWDLIIAHPPCTYLASTGARWLYDSRHPTRVADRELAVVFAKTFMDYADKVCIENPVGYLSTAWRKPDQTIQPYEYGHTASKKTCLWLKGLPKLTPTNIVEPEYVVTSTGKRFSKWYWDTSKLRGEARQAARSRTFAGIANAMAQQWGT